MSSHVAQIFDHSSRDSPTQDADPLMLLYRSLDVHTPDIARVVLRIHHLRMLAKNMEYRLAPLLVQDVHGYDLSISSLLSVNGKGLKYLTTETKSYNFVDNSKKSNKTMREIFTGDMEQSESGIPIPEG